MMFKQILKCCLSAKLIIYYVRAVPSSYINRMITAYLSSDLTIGICIKKLKIQYKFNHFYQLGSYTYSKRIPISSI